MTLKVAVLSGGGSHGAFQSGSLCNVVNHITFDGFFGVSTGALSAAIMAQLAQGGQKEQAQKLVNIYDSITDNKSIYNSPPLGYLGKGYRLLFKDSIYDPIGLRKLIAENINPRGWASAFGCGVTRVEDGKYYSIGSYMTNENLLKGILASASYPVFFPPVRISYYHYIDGGVRRQTPLKDAVNWITANATKNKLDGTEEAKELHLFLTAPLNAGYFAYNKPNALTLLLRSIGILSTSVYIDDLTSLLQYNSNPAKSFITTYLYIPPIDYGNSLDFNPSSIDNMRSDGYNCKPVVLTNITDLNNYLGVLG